SARPPQTDSRYFCAARTQPRRAIADRAGAIAVPFAAAHADVASPVATNWRNRHARSGGNAIGSRPTSGPRTDRATRARAGSGAQDACGPAPGTQAASMAGRGGRRLHERGQIDAVEF